MHRSNLDILISLHLMALLKGLSLMSLWLILSGWEQFKPFIRALRTLLLIFWWISLSNQLHLAQEFQYSKLLFVQLQIFLRDDDFLYFFLPKQVKQQQHSLTPLHFFGGQCYPESIARFYFCDNFCLCYFLSLTFGLTFWIFQLQLLLLDVQTLYVKIFSHFFSGRVPWELRIVYSRLHH